MTDKKTKDTETLTLSKKDLKEIISTVLEAANAAPAPAKTTVADTSLNQEINRRIKEGDIYNSRLAKDTRRERITIDKLYVPYTGTSVTSSINGSVIKVPVDGKPYEVHPAHYAAIRGYLTYISDQIERNSGNDDFLGIAEGDVGKIN